MPLSQRALDLIRLAVDPGASEEEARTAALVACKIIAGDPDAQRDDSELSSRFEKLLQVAISEKRRADDCMRASRDFSRRLDAVQARAEVRERELSSLVAALRRQMAGAMAERDSVNAQNVLLRRQLASCRGESQGVSTSPGASSETPGGEAPSPAEPRIVVRFREGA